MDAQNEVVTFEITVASATAREVERVIAENGWERTEGLCLILGSGLGYLQGEKTLKAIESGAMTAQDLHKLVPRMMETKSRLAVLRFRAFELERSNQNWELSTGAIQNERMGLRGVVHRLREEIAALKAENAQLRRQLPAQETSSQSPAATPQPRVQAGLGWLRLFRRTSPKEMSGE